MTVKIVAYDCLCELETFVINEIAAEYYDFGTKYDCDAENAEQYCCGNMRFFPKEPCSEVLQKYGITVEEYNEICSRLENELSFGCCGWCS